MSQSKQESSKKNNPMQAKKIFEDDIGDDFLSSWKPSAPKKDAALEFGSEAPSKAQRTSFSLDKFDVDFDFDGGFGKLSFDVDMSDLDFKSPSSKTKKPKAKLQEVSQEKKDGFEFDFDFNELGGFDLDCMLPKGREEKKTHVQEKSLTNTSKVSETGKEGKEGKKNAVQENASMHSSEKSKSVSKRTIKVISQKCDDNSSIHYSGEVRQQLPEVQLNFKLSEISMEEVDSQHGVPSELSAQSPCTSASQDLGSKKHMQNNPDKQIIMDDSCFKNLLQTGDSNTVKQRSIQTESQYFERVVIPKNNSKAIPQNVDNESESHDGREVQEQPTVAQSAIKLVEFSMEDVNFQHETPKSFAKSLQISSSQDVQNYQCKQPNGEKQSVIEDTCFGNLFPTGNPINAKQTSNLAKSKYFEKVAFSRSKKAVTPKNIDNNSECCDDGTMPKQTAEPFPKSNLSEFSIEDVALQCKKVTTDKQDDTMVTCFENTLKAGDSNALKQTSHPTESQYSDKEALSPRSSSCSGSGHKLSSHIISEPNSIPSEDLEGDQDQSLAQNGGFSKRMANYDVASKNSSPRKTERSKCTSDNSTSTSICTVDRKDMKQNMGKLATVAHKDINDITKRQVNQSQNQEDFGQYKSTWSRSPLLLMQREITSKRSITSKSSTDHNRKQELNTMNEESGSPKHSEERLCLPGDAKINSTEPSGASTKQLSRHSDINQLPQQNEEQHDSIMNCQDPGTELLTDVQEIDKLASNSISMKSKDVSPGEKKKPINNNYITSRPRQNFLQGLTKQCQNTSLAKDLDNMATERNSSAAQTKTQDTAQKDLSGLAKTNETNIRVGGLLGESSKAIISGTKSALVVIPLKPSKNLPMLQISRPQLANGKPNTVLKQTNERLSSSKPSIRLSPKRLLTRKIFPLMELNNTPSSPLPPLKRKPMEKMITDASTMNPLKRIARLLPVKEYMLVDDVRKNQNHLTSLESLARDQTYRKTPRGHPSESSPGIVSGEKPQDSQKLPKSIVQEEGLENVQQTEFTGSTNQPDQCLNSHSLFQNQIKYSDDISVPDFEDNVRKADSFSRELEYMYNMLQKKHEEAKDVLIRSIVTNNLLLMLNHPLHEEKIQTIKMYAVSLLPNNAQDDPIK